MKTTKEETWPCIEDLPLEQQEPFARWLDGQACPIGGYYPWDYERWKRQWKHPSTSS